MSSNKVYTKRLYDGTHPVDFNVTSELNSKLFEKETWEIKMRSSNNPRVQLLSANVDLLDTINIIDTYDRPGSTRKESTYARSGKEQSGFEDKPGKRLPKSQVFAEAGVGRARAELSVLEAEAKGPNAGASAAANVIGLSAMARAEVGSASAKAGPVGVKVGLGVDTGASIGAGGVEVKILGTGVSFGPKTSVSLLGSEVSCSVM
ncbi:uncharacterized protein LOC130553244 [Triplophysa rosa]|uniref:Uncharacterized protein n=1 Tax=Triplophysa rosa TaxID=992332 RepID=A0A9W7WZ03_TRIRA|nr:uncharacterized protein LOC130553244 [Triplophysa rosa]KAI7810738.1 hypothetical protein IRJ41_006032 [Triplophysa rosa]